MTAVGLQQRLQRLRLGEADLLTPELLTTMAMPGSENTTVDQESNLVELARSDSDFLRHCRTVIYIKDCMQEIFTYSYIDSSPA